MGPMGSQVEMTKIKILIAGTWVNQGP
jgi:hypothetical protein